MPRTVLSEPFPRAHPSPLAQNSDIPDDVLSMSPEDIVRRNRLIDNEIRVLKVSRGRLRWPARVREAPRGHSGGLGGGDQGPSL